MNRYRLVFQYDDFDEYMCLKCKNKFVQTDKLNYTIFDTYIYCPICGTKWDGFFSTQHKKYKIPQINIPKYPRIQIEYSTIITHELGDGFYPIPVKPYIQWNLYNYTPFAPRYWNSDKSLVITLYNTYKHTLTYPNNKNKFRLLYMRSNIDFDIINV